MEKKMGRPPKPADEILGIRIDLRVSAAERHEYDSAAERAKLSLSEWIRDRLNKAAKRESK